MMRTLTSSPARRYVSTALTTRDKSVAGSPCLALSMPRLSAPVPSSRPASRAFAQLVDGEGALAGVLGIALKDDPGVGEMSNAEQAGAVKSGRELHRFGSVARCDVGVSGETVVNGGVCEDVAAAVGVVVLANTGTEAVNALGYWLFQTLRGEPPALALPRLVTLSPEALGRCTGRFELEPDFYLTITLERGALFAQFAEGPKHSIYPSSETTFHYVVDQVRLEMPEIPIFVAIP